MVEQMPVVNSHHLLQVGDVLVLWVLVIDLGNFDLVS